MSRPDRPLRVLEVQTLRAVRVMLVLSAPTILAFWAFYRALDPTYFDPLAYRVVCAASTLVVLGVTYLSEWFQRRAIVAAAIASCGLIGYFGYLAGINGLDGPWSLGALAVTASCGLVLMLLSTRERDAAASIVFVIAVLGAALLASGAYSVNAGLLMGYLVVLGILAYVGSAVRVRTLRYLQESRSELQARERTLRTVIDAIPQHIYMKDREGRCLVRNAFSAEQMGFASPEDAVGLTVFDTSDDAEVAAAYWAEERRVIETGEPDLNREEELAYGGQRGWCVTSRVPLLGADGEVVGLVGVTHNVTAQKEAEIALREAKEAADAQRLLLRTIIDTIPDSIFVRDRAGRCVVRNLADARLIGYERPEDTVGLTIFDVAPEPLAREIAASDRALLESGEAVFGREEHYDAPDGRSVTLSTTKVPLQGPDGEVIGLVGISRDVTEQKRAEGALREAKEAAESQRLLLRTLVDALPDAIFVVDREGRFLTANAVAVGQTSAATAEEVEGRTPHEMFPPEVAERVAEGARTVIRTGETIWNMESSYTDVDGSERTVSTTRVPLRDRGGEVVGMVGITRDVTGEHEIRAALEAQRQEAEESRTLLRTIIDSLPDYIYVNDRAGRGVARNLASAQMLGYASSEEGNGLTAFDVLPPSEAQFDWDSRSA